MSSSSAFCDGLVEAGQQLRKGLAFLAYERRQGVVTVVGYSDTAYRVHLAEGDLPVVDELRDTRQGQGDRSFLACGLGYAALQFADCSLRRRSMAATPRCER
jgi:hypothetical protein